MFITEIGHLALALSIPAALVQLYPATRIIRQRFCALYAALVSVAFLALLWAHWQLDFSVAIVALSTQTNLPWYYRISATWSHHEGSMLLWTMLLSWCSVMLAFGKSDALLRHTATAVQASIGAAFSAFLLLTSNPFARLFPIPSDGRDLNPLLQDIGLIIHPPLLYSGYVLCGAIFSITLATLWQHKQAPRVWQAPLLRQYVMLSWLFLTAGIALGSAWAYYELGWGGYWFWDPVENAALIPWLIVTGLIHAVQVTQRSGDFARHTALCAIFAFSAALLGTFLVRSGVVTSVHAFSSAPGRGIFVLCLLFGFTALGMLLYVWRMPPLGRPLRVWGRRGLLALNTIILSAMACVVLTGTLYPNILEAVGGAKISVGAPYFNKTILPMAALIALLLPLGVLMPQNGQRFWRNATAQKMLRALGLFAVAMLLLLLALYWPRAVWGWGGFALAAWVLASSAHYLWRAWRGSTRIAWPMVLGHIGFASLMIGVTAMADGTQTFSAPLRVQQSVQFQNNTFTLQRLALRRDTNHVAERAIIVVQPAGNARPYVLTPERRVYNSAGQQIIESSIRTGLAQNVYTNIGGVENDAEAVMLRIFWHPLALFIWGGAAFMVAAAALVLWQSWRARRSTTPA